MLFGSRSKMSFRTVPLPSPCEHSHCQLVVGSMVWILNLPLHTPPTPPPPPPWWGRGNGVDKSNECMDGMQIDTTNFKYRKGTSIRQAPVFWHLSEHYGKAKKCGSLLSLDEWIIIILHSVTVLTNQAFESYWLHCSKCRILVRFKGEVQSRITHNFKRKHKKFPRRCECKNDENRIRNSGSCDILEISHFFGKHFLTSRLWIFKWVSWWLSSPHNFLHISFTKLDKNAHIFSYRECKPCLISTQNKWEIKFSSDIFWYKDHAFTFICEKNPKIFKISCIIWYDKLWGDDITNSLIWIFIRTGQEMFSEKIWNFKMSQLSLHFLSDFHHFGGGGVICSGQFLLFLLKCMVMACRSGLPLSR